MGHVKRMNTNASVRRCERLAEIGLRRDRGRLRKHWGEVIKYDKMYLQLTEDMALDGKTWR